MANAERLNEAKEMRKLVIEAITGLTKRGAKSWNIGGQTYTSMDVDELLKLLKYWDNIIADLTGGRRIVRRVLPIDD